jgi:hypothetical protein
VIINGVSIGSGAAGSGRALGSTNYLSAYTNCCGRIDALYDDFAIFSSIMTPAQVISTAMGAQGISTAAANLQLLFKFEQSINSDYPTDGSVQLQLNFGVTANTFTADEPAAIAAIQGDPQLIGFRGQKFQFHGVAGEIFSLITARLLQCNAKFVYLTARRSRDIRALRNSWSAAHAATAQRLQLPETLSFSHNGNYIDAIALKIRGRFNGHENRDRVAECRVLVESGPYERGPAISIDGRRVDVAALQQPSNAAADESPRFSLETGSRGSGGCTLVPQNFSASSSDKSAFSMVSMWFPSIGSVALEARAGREAWLSLHIDNSDRFLNVRSASIAPEALLRAAAAWNYVDNHGSQDEDDDSAGSDSGARESDATGDSKAQSPLEPVLHGLLGHTLYQPMGAKSLPVGIWSDYCADCQNGAVPAAERLWSDDFPVNRY